MLTRIVRPIAQQVQRRTIFTSVMKVDELDTLLQQKDTVQVLWFTAQWCGPCQKISPLCQQLGERDDVNMIKIDVDMAADVAAKYNISSVPTFQFVQNQAEVKGSTIVGANAEKLQKTIQNLTK